MSETSCATTETLARFASGELSSDERVLVLDHAAGCEACHAAITIAMTEVSSPVVSPLTVPTKIDRYTLGPVLGRGAMGVVHVAHDPELGRDVALKILRPLGSPERLRREAQALAKLAHPNVVRVYDIGEDAGHTFIAMELVDGENLRTWLATPRTTDEVLAVLLAAGRGLAAAHAVGLVHRDFKPDNVLISSKGDVLVGDFGLARIAAPPSQDGPAPATALAMSTDELTATGAVVGTPAYMAPEQIEGDASAPVDQYAFCVTAWEALYGRRPFDGATLAEVRANARAGRVVRPDGGAVPRHVDAALRRGLAEDPAARFSSMEALLAALSPPRSRRTWIAASVALVALGGSGAAWLALRAPAIDCAGTAALIAPAWGPAVDGMVRGRFGDRVAGTFAAFAGQWQRARVEACSATHVRHEQSAASLDRRVACLDRARATLGVTISTLMSHDDIERPDTVAESLPSLERCDAAAAPPPRESEATIASVEAELTRLEVVLAAGSPSISLAEAAALRERAAKLGYTPTLLHARMLEARIARWTGASAQAEAILRDVIVAAERANDDAARALASAVLASLVANTHREEAEQLIASGHAALARAGDDPKIAEALISAEVDVLEARGKLREAATLQEQLLARIDARLPEPTGTTLGAIMRLVSLWGTVGDFDKSALANQRQWDVAMKLEPLSNPAAFADNVYAHNLKGDFMGAVQVGSRQLAFLRAMPHQNHNHIGAVLAQVGYAYEADLDFDLCIDTYRAVEAEWSFPVEAYRTDENEPPSQGKLVADRIDAILGIVSCLSKRGSHADAAREARRARELALSLPDDETVRSLLPVIDRMLGIALVDNGELRAGRELLEPVVRAMANDPRLYPRALARFSLGRALWDDAGTADRPRARALVEDAIRDIDTALATPQFTTRMLRKGSTSSASARRAGSPRTRYSDQYESGFIAPSSRSGSIGRISFATICAPMMPHTRPAPNAQNPSDTPTKPGPPGLVATNTQPVIIAPMSESNEMLEGEIGSSGRLFW